jgi:hypothetical protein
MMMIEMVMMIIDMMTMKINEVKSFSAIVETSFDS